MGQYYRVIMEKEENKRTILNRNVNGEYTFAKLTEHSWWENPFVNTVCSLLYKKPCKIAWVGDYADDFEFYKEVWDTKGKGVSENQTKLDGKYLCNHTLKQFVDCDEYFLRSKTDEDEYGVWCLHPLPLLTCVGNGQGGGDYYSKIGMELVGTWCWNSISVEDEVPEGFTKVDCCFKEV